MKNFLIILTGLFLLGVLGYICIYHLNHKVRIQDDVNSRTITALSEQKLNNVSIRTDGRDVILTGEVASESIRQQAENYSRKVFGVRTVKNKLTVTSTEFVVEPESKPDALEPIKKEMPQALKPETLTEYNCQQDFDALLSSNNINFINNSDDIDASSNNFLINLIVTANQCPEAKIEISGYTYPHDNNHENSNISKARASSVMNYLTSNGLDATRLSVVDYSKTIPVAKKENDKSLTKKTRIVFNVKGL